jgi:hypothetical protein
LRVRRSDGITRGWSAAALFVILLGGCATGFESLQEERIRYNEVVKATAEEQLLLNIVRLRYTDTPSSLSVTAIAMQSEVQRAFQVVPFFSAAGDVQPRGFTSVLPGAQVSTADRPTITLTPLDDQDFTRRLFTPMTAEGVLYLARTTWPISTVFRLWLEHLNWVPNAPSASGPTPERAPSQTDFQRGIEALQTLQDRGLITFAAEEREEVLAANIPADTVTAKDLLDAAKEGYQYHLDAQARSWALVKRRRAPVMRVHPDAVSSAYMEEVARTFHLRRGLGKYEIEIEKLEPFTHPPRGLEILDLDTRSLLQVMNFVSKGVDIPPEHVAQGIVRVTTDGNGAVFDWQSVTGGIFRASWSRDQKPPPTAHVATRYQGYWFYIDKRDQDTMSTFSLLMEMGRLELPGTRQLQSPTLTLPLGGR